MPTACFTAVDREPSNIWFAGQLISCLVLGLHAPAVSASPSYWRLCARSADYLGLAAMETVVGISKSMRITEISGAHFSKALTNATQALSPVGRCRTFDAAGDGYGRGEGFAVAVLRLAEPLRNPGQSSANWPPPERMCCGIILSSAVNQDGRSSGLTAPNGPSQSALVRAVLAAAGATQDAVGAISVHGTGAGP